MGQHAVFFPHLTSENDLPPAWLHAISKVYNYVVITSLMLVKLAHVHLT